MVLWVFNFTSFPITRCGFFNNLVWVVNGYRGTPMVPVREANPPPELSLEEAHRPGHGPPHCVHNVDIPPVLLCIAILANRMPAKHSMKIINFAHFANGEYKDQIAILNHPVIRSQLDTQPGEPVGLSF